MFDPDRMPIVRLSDSVDQILSFQSSASGEILEELMKGAHLLAENLIVSPLHL